MKVRNFRRLTYLLPFLAIVFLIVILIAQGPRVQAWAWDTHRFIVEEAEDVFSEGSFFSNHLSTLREWSVKPDQWKSSDPYEQYRHWYHVDHPHGEDGYWEGVLPWAVEDNFTTLVYTLEAGDWQRAAELMGAISHYTQDATMPLHATSDYNPGYNHVSYEIGVDDHLDEISIPEYVPQEFDNIFEATMAVLEESYEFTGYTENKLSYWLIQDILWNDTIRDITENRLRAGVQFTANLWYTAMIWAGLTILPPTLEEPKDGATVTTSTPTFTWTHVTGTSFYDFQLASDNGFTSDVLTVKDLSTNSYTLTDPLSSGEWYWRVRAGDNSTHVGLWSQTQNFIVEVWANDIILRGSETAYGMNLDAIPPMRSYVMGDCPPLMAADRVGSGAVVAAPLAATCRWWNDPGNPDPHFDVLLDVLFQWMVPGATNVIWYEGYNVYNNCGVCTALISALMDLGYDVACDDTEPIASFSLDAFDILVIPQTELGPEGTGDPSLFPDSDVQAIKAWVEGGGGLLIMDESDFLSYNYYKVHNKILDGLGFSPGGVNLRFQSAALYDDVNNYGVQVGEAGDPYRPIVDVDTTTAVGAAYQSRTGKSTLGVYSPGSLAVPSENRVSVEVAPFVNLGEAGDNLVYEAMITNVGSKADNYTITIVDNLAWSISVSEDEISLAPGEDAVIGVKVTVPEDVTEKVADWVTLKASGVSGAENSADFRAISVVPLEEPPYPIAHPEETHFWFSVCTQLVELPAVPIMTGVETGFSADLTEREPWSLLYGENEYPPVAAAALVGDGRVITAGPAALRSSPVDWYTNPNLVSREFAPLWSRWLLDWDDPRGCKFLYYCTDTPDTFHDPSRVATWLDDMKNGLGFELDTQVGEEITPELLENYDVLQIAELKRPLTGDEKQTIKEWVERGGGLLLMCQADYAGMSAPKYPNEVLEALGVPIRFQDDEMYDEDHWILTGPWVPQVYLLDPREANPEFDVWFAPVRGVDVSISPKEKFGEPENTLSYTVTVMNTGNVGDNYDLDATDDAGWSPSISPVSLTISPGESETAVLSVIIPSDTPLGTIDNITVAATSQGDPAVSGGDSCVAYVLLTRVEDVPVGKTTVDARPKIDATVTAETDQTGTVTLAKYEDNPGGAPPSGFSALGKFIEVTTDISSENIVWPVEIRIYYLDNEIPEDVSESSLRIYWWDGSDWVPEDNTGVNTDNNYVWAFVNHLSPFAPMGFKPSVSVSISPDYQSALPGRTIEYTVIVINTSPAQDIYDLTAADNLGWAPSVSPSSLIVPAGENKTATLSVSIPEDAASCTRDSVTVTATSRTDDTVENTASCTTHVRIVRRVDISISPTYQSGTPGTTLNYTVEVTNRGTAEDTFDLEVSGGAGWSPRITPGSLTLAEGVSGTSTLSVTVPSGATSTSVTVTATSRADPTVSDSVSCTATATIVAGPPTEEKPPTVPTGPGAAPGVAPAAPTPSDLPLALILISVVVIVFSVGLILQGPKRKS